MTRPIRDLQDEKFGDLTVLQYSGTNEGKSVFWLCKCLCGVEVTYTSAQLLHGHHKKRACPKCQKIKHHEAKKRMKEAVTKAISTHAGKKLMMPTPGVAYYPGGVSVHGSDPEAQRRRYAQIEARKKAMS